VSVGSPVFAATSTIVESETSNPDVSNNSMSWAQTISVSNITALEDYILVNGTFHDEEDDADYYAITPKAGYQGRLAVTLRNIPSLNDYDIQLLSSTGAILTNPDDNGRLQYPQKLSNTTEMVKSNETNGSAKIYIKVIPKSVYSSYSEATYQLKIERLITTTTLTTPLTPSTLNSTSNAWSADAYVNYTTLPDDAFFISGTVEAKKHETVLNTSNNKLRVRFDNPSFTGYNNTGYSQEITWASGPLTISGIGQPKIKGPWCAGFKATELPVMILNKPSYVGVVSMNSFKMSVTYGYDRFRGQPYSQYF
jgi:hypothetical protein